MIPPQEEGARRQSGSAQRGGAERRSNELGVALGWHRLSFEDRLAAVRRAEARGYAAAFVDGDVSQIASLGEADVLDGWTTTAFLLARTRSIAIGSIRIATHWNAARLAQAAATLDHLAPGRLRFLISIGDQASDRRFGFPPLAPAERIRWLEETLAALRALWQGETVTRKGRYVTLDGARIRPHPPRGRLGIWVAARRPRLLRVVATHADGWDVNLPPVRARVEQATTDLDAACHAVGRDPRSIRRSMWIFTRPGADPEDPELRHEFRRLNPWFSDLGDGELEEAIVAGPPAACRARIARIAEDFGLDLPVIDLSGLDRKAALRSLEAMAPGDAHVDGATRHP